MEKISLILNRISAGTTIVFGGLYIIESLSHSTSGMMYPAVFPLAMGSIILFTSTLLFNINQFKKQN
ncbi:hypothetical protein [Clostridium sp. Marseille-Q7071]